MQQPTKDMAYVFGHSAREVRRLELQAGLLAPGTERILRAAGLAPGMSVLDIGTGAGDVAIMAAALVGPLGSVLGIDRDAGVLDRARLRSADVAGLRYEAVALEALPPSATFDVVLSRYVIQHQADHAGFLRTAAGHVRPGGTLICMAPGLLSAELGQRWSFPRAPLYDQARDLNLTAVRFAGISMTVGMEFVRLFHEIGMPEPAVLREEIVGGPSSALIEHLCLTVGSLLPLLVKRGVTTASAIGIDTLQERMRAEATANRSQLCNVNLLGAWATVG